MDIKKPYLLFLGDAKDDLALKTAYGIMDWKPEWVIGQYALENIKISVGATNLSLEQAWQKGARSFVIGVVNAGGVLPTNWIKTIIKAINIGYDIVSGMHQRLQDIPEIAEAQKITNVNLVNLRYVDKKFTTGNGIKRSGKRVLTVGTDCSIGKKYTSLALYEAFVKDHIESYFCATGQTGVLIAEKGVSIDSVVSDFISGAAEYISPNTAKQAWSFVEGQGSLFHPSFAGVTLGLLHGSQPDYFIVCHEPTRKKMRNVDYLLPSITDVIKQTIAMGRLTNPDIYCAGISINTSALTEKDAKNILKEYSKTYSLPCCDPLRFGCEDIKNYLLNLNDKR